MKMSGTDTNADVERCASSDAEKHGHAPFPEPLIHTQDARDSIIGIENQGETDHGMQDVCTTSKSAM